MTTVKIYGIKNCDTMKKAMNWLKDHSIDFEFHDYKKLSIDEENLRFWLSKFPWDELINKRGTTWRKLPEDDKVNIDQDKAVQLMLTNTSLIKRPILSIQDLSTHKDLLLGFKEEQYHRIFK